MLCSKYFLILLLIDDAICKDHSGMVKKKVKTIIITATTLSLTSFDNSYKLFLLCMYIQVAKWLKIIIICLALFKKYLNLLWLRL